MMSYCRCSVKTETEQALICKSDVELHTLGFLMASDFMVSDENAPVIQKVGCIRDMASVQIKTFNFFP